MTLPTVAVLTAALASQLEDTEAAVGAAAAQALERVAKIVGDVVVPDVVELQACVDVGAELYYRQRVRHGVVQLGDGDGGLTPVRVNRNPDAVAYPTLAPWVGAGIA